ncbi:MAG: LGFP repeat-containing protein [Mycobacterium sp.]
MANLRGLLASPGLDGAPMKGVYFFPGEGTDDSNWTTHPRFVGDRHWNSDASTRGWVLDRMAAAHVNTVVASWWNTACCSPMTLTEPPAPQPKSWSWLVDAVNERLTSGIGKQPLLIMPAIESALTPQFGWRFADEYPAFLGGLVDRVGWLCEMFDGRYDVWAQMYDLKGRPRHAINIVHACSNVTLSDTEFANGFEVVAKAVHDKWKIDVGFTLDTIPNDHYTAWPGYAGPALLQSAPVLAIHGFTSEIFSPNIHGGDNNIDNNISAMADWKRDAMHDWIREQIPLVLDVSNGYDGHKTFTGSPIYGDTMTSTNDRWRNWMSELKNPGIVGLCVDCWNGYTEGYATVPSAEHGDTVYRWLTELLEPDPREYNHMHFANHVATHRVYGAICERWIRLGADRRFGAPVTDELTSGQGRSQEFTDGKSIYWGPNTGAFELHGLIAQAYREAGGGTSPLGLPISDEEDFSVNVSGNPVSGRRNRFEHGTITWLPGDGSAEIHYTG